uniref:Interferon omega-1-like n=1 Tax=Pogona vitticeps TaxID=103695 RepID=A0A6J0U1A2_9SAUR
MEEEHIARLAHRTGPALAAPGKTDMAFKSPATPAALLYLGLVLSAQAAALDCNFLKLQQERFHRESLKQLEKMISKFSPRCREQAPDFNFPAETLKTQDSWLAAKDILSGFLAILSSDRLKTSWETPLFRDRFLNGLFAQTESIQRCLEERQVTWGRSKYERANKQGLKRYFQRIRAFLEEKGHKACAYESLQLEFQRSFMYIDILLKRTDTGAR